jgi:Tfp pilus assembly protein PilO
MAPPSSSQMIDNFAKKSTGYKAAVFIFIGAILGLAYWQLMLSSLQEERDQERSSRSKLLRDQQQLDADLKKLKELVKENEELQETIRLNARALPTEAELPSFFDHLQRKAGEAGVSIKKWERKSEVAVEEYMKVPVEIELAGTYYQISKYFSLLAPQRPPLAAPSLTPPPPPAGGAAGAPAAAAPQASAEASDVDERIVSIENLTIGDPEVRSDEIILTAKFTAATYRQGDAVAPAAGAPAKPAAAAPAKPDKAAMKGGAE